MEATLAFRYPRWIAVTALLGAPLSGVAGAIMIAAVVLGLLRFELDVAHLASSVFLVLLSVLMIYASYMGIRFWYVPFSDYEVDGSGVTVKHVSPSQLLPWRDVVSARYRRFAGQLELSSPSISRPIVLTNVDMNWTRATLSRALDLVKSNAITIHYQLL